MNFKFFFLLISLLIIVILSFLCCSNFPLLSKEQWEMIGHSPEIEEKIPAVPVYYSKMENFENISPDSDVYRNSIIPISYKVDEIDSCSEYFLSGIFGNYFQREAISHTDACNGYRYCIGSRYILPYGDIERNWNKGNFEALINLNTFYSYADHWHASQPCDQHADIYFISDNNTGPFCVSATNEDEGDVFLNVSIDGIQIFSRNIGLRDTWKRLQIFWDKNTLDGINTIVIFVNDKEVVRLDNQLPDLKSHIFKTRIFNRASSYSDFSLGMFVKWTNTFVMLDEFKVWDTTENFK